MEWIWKKDGSKSEREGLQHGSMTYCDLWFGDGGTDKKERKPSGKLQS